MLKWPYEHGSPRYPCWIIAPLGPDRPHLALAYSERGHGAYGDRWGIVSENEDWFGRDDSWFLLLEDAAISAGLWSGPLPDEYEIRQPGCPTKLRIHGRNVGYVWIVSDFAG